MENDVRAFNLLRFGLLPGILILGVTMLMTSGWTAALELLLVASVPLFLGFFVLGWMFSTIGPTIKKRLNDSIERAQYLRPSYILSMFVLTSMTIAVLAVIFHISPNIVLPSSLIAIVLITLAFTKTGGNVSQQPPVSTLAEREDEDYSYGYRGTYVPTGKRDPQPQQGVTTDELPQSQYEESMPSVMR